MEINSTNQENLSVFTKWWNKLKDIPRKFKKKIEKIAKNTKQIGKDDPRKIWHAFKVGLALTLVSLFYYTEPLFHNFDQPIMWAILTVVVTFEFTAGATISKSINRGIGTALAGAFGLGAKYLSELIGRDGPNPIVLGVLVFIVGVLGTFTRFYPHIKRRYDYGTMIFVLTFSLVAVSGYRSENIFELAYQRISTILIGVFTVMFISMIIRPVWAGEDLHKLASTNLEKLATYLEGFGSEYFHISEIKSVEGNNNNEKGFHEALLSIIGSKANEESLANLAWWEPPHGGFKFNHPWKQYLKIGSLVRKCSCHLLALNSHINSKSQAPNEFERRTEEVCKNIIMESKNALKEFALSIKTMAQPISLIHDIKNVIDDLKLTLGPSKTFFRYDESRVMDCVPIASVVSLLIAVTKCVDEISEAIEELSSKARFKKKSMSPATTSRSHRPRILHRGTVNPIVEDEVDGGDFVTIEISHDNVESKGKVVVEEVNPIVKDEVDGADCVTIEISHDNVESKGKVVVEEVNPIVKDEVDGGDCVTIEISHDNVESKGKVVVEEVNPIVKDEVDGVDCVTIKISHDNVESKGKVVVEEVNPIVKDEVDGGNCVTIEIGHDNVESKGKVVVEEVNSIVEDEVDGGDCVTIEIGHDNVESKGKVVVEEVNSIVEDEVDGGDCVTMELGDNVESKGEVVVEEVNQVNNPINAIKEESFVIWIRGSTTMAIVEEMKTPTKIGDFMDLVDIKLYNSTQFFESTKGVLTVLEGANQVNNLLTATEGKSIVIVIRGNMTTTKVEEMKTAEEKETL